jgi:predicted RNase H-like nuclease (RuvC/YqgF family)
MQKNIVFGVNAAMGTEGSNPKETPVNGTRSEEFKALKEDIASLKQENHLFATAVEEMKAQNEELKSKIEELISNVSAKAKPSKKKKGKQKQTAR